MGYNTFKSLPNGPLSDRINIVIADGNPDLGDGVKVFETVGKAIDYCKSTYMNKNIYVIGGGKIYYDTMDIATELDLTIVDDYRNGDVYFPEYEYENEWMLKEQHYVKDGGYDTYHCKFVRNNVENNGYLKRYFDRVNPTDDWHEEWMSKDDKFMIRRLDYYKYELTVLSSNINSKLVERFYTYNKPENVYDVLELISIVRKIYGD